VFVLLPTYIAPIEQVDALLAEHRAWLEAQYATGRFLFAGRREPREGGFILAADGDRAELERLAATDPFAVGGVTHYDVIEVRPTGGIPAVLDALSRHGVEVG
jgi:uncharacterized protein YciI